MSEIMERDVNKIRDQFLRQLEEKGDEMDLAKKS